MAREFSRDLALLIADQPTRGIDVGSIEFIHKQIVAKRDAGTAVLLVSAELDEIMELSDRIGVMYRGRLVAVLDAATAEKDRVGLIMVIGNFGGRGMIETTNPGATGMNVDPTTLVGGRSTASSSPRASRSCSACSWGRC